MLYSCINIYNNQYIYTYIGPKDVEELVKRYKRKCGGSRMSSVGEKIERRKGKQTIKKEKVKTKLRPSKMYSVR